MVMGGGLTCLFHSVCNKPYPLDPHCPHPSETLIVKETLDPECFVARPAESWLLC